MARSEIEDAVRAFLAGLGLDVSGDDLARTPGRVARAWQEELLSGYGVEPEEVLTWTEVAGELGPVMVRQVSFASICLHHLLPFSGFAHVAYLPGRRLAGLSKIGRVIDAHARRLQTQENLTRAIVDTLQSTLEPRGVVAMLDAEHTCMSIRGVRKEQSRMVTLATSGIYETDLAERSQVLDLLSASGRSTAAR